MKFDQPVSIIVKAYNEESNVGEVLKVLSPIEWIDEVIVVNDGSTDRTAEIVKKFENSRIKLVNRECNGGVGAAMATGVKFAKHDLLLFLDSDLLGLKESHLLQILAPIVFTRQADLVLGVFGLKNLGEHTSTKIANRFIPFITGQRAVWRKSMPPISKMTQSRFGADLLITRHVPKARRAVVKLNGLSQVTKEKKAHGDFVKSLTARVKMYQEISKVLAQKKDEYYFDLEAEHKNIAIGDKIKSIKGK
jgi:glycosyltransferase involved in cell wall biosynthesis